MPKRIEYVRVRDERGNEFSVVAKTFDKRVHRKVDGPAADAGGNPLPDVPAPKQSPAPVGDDTPGPKAATKKEKA